MIDPVSAEKYATPHFPNGIYLDDEEVGINSLYFYNRNDPEGDSVAFFEKLGSETHSDERLNSYGLLLDDSATTAGGTLAIEIDSKGHSITLRLGELQQRMLGVDEFLNIPLERDVPIDSTVDTLVEILRTGGFEGPVERA